MQHNASDPGTAYVVGVRGGEPVGVMRLYDYVTRALLAWYLDHYSARSAPFAILWPFRTDFYRAIGFGYGTPAHRYRFAPATLRDDGARGTIREVRAADADAVIACYERVRARTNGLAAFQRWRLERLLDDAALRYVAVEDGGEIRAFMQTSTVTPDDDLARGRDELLVRDVISEDPPYRAALFRYLRSQQDQFARVMIESQDGALYLSSTDPRDGSEESVAPPTGHRIARTGQGMMYRIVDMASAFAHLTERASPFVLRVDVDDPFFAPTNGTWTFRFETTGGAAPAGGASADATLRIGIADLASVVMGSLRLRDLVRNGLAAVEPRAMADRVDAAFRADDPPVCITRF
jgi:predicted acetyltransferase